MLPGGLLLTVKGRQPMTNETDPIKPPVSEAKRLANIRNAQMSTGPRTAEGKAASRCNAVKHGLCAEVVAIPGENGELFDSRFGDWSGELNPLSLKSVDYIVAQLVRKSIRLDRCHLVYDATVANLARNALRARANDRADRIEVLVRMFPDDADIAVRRLREFPEGCDFLIKEWEQFDAALIEPTHWDDDDNRRSIELQGRYRAIHNQSPCQLVTATIAMVEHREVAAKLKLNETPDLVAWKLQYRSDLAHEHDRERVMDLELKAIGAKDQVETVIAQAIAELKARKAELDATEGLEVAEATVRARFDDTDRAKLIHRHESDLERGFLRGFKEAREITRWAMQVKEGKAVATDRSWSGVAPGSVRPARNEATAVEDRRPRGGWKAVEHDGYSEVDVSIVPKIGHKRKQ
jgi:hypothetical protein